MGKKQISIKRRMYKLWYIHIVEYYLAIKNKINNWYKQQHD